jgi:hypothetical protein
MDLRTFRTNGPGLAQCEAETAWPRLWAQRDPEHARIDPQRGHILTTIWTQLPALTRTSETVAVAADQIPCNAGGSCARGSTIEPMDNVFGPNRRPTGDRGAFLC